jgi:drug/metabolite transporter (DMT)-like permease
LFRYNQHLQITNEGAAITTDLLGIFLALTSAAVWGGGDFAGGRAAARAHQYQVLVISGFSGLVLLAAFALLLGERFPSWQGVLWSVLGGLMGAVGLASLYRGLALGSAAVVAPVSAVISTALPVIFAAWYEGLPGTERLLGFVLAAGGIWLVSAASTPGTGSRQGFWLACLAGAGFGGFFIFLSLVEHGKIFTPLIIARCFTLLAGLLLVRLYRLPFPSLTANPPALLAGLLDAGGNLLYVMARQYTRVDVAAVLSSLYPASTVLLSAVLLKEKITPTQKVGVLICLAAVMLIAR